MVFDECPQYEDLVDLPPFFSSFFGKPFINHWHDLIKQLTVPTR